MATLTYGEAIGERVWLEREFQSKTFSFSETTPDLAVLTDENGYSIEFVGVGLTFKNGKLTGGTLSEVRFLDSEEGILASVTDLSVKAASVDPDPQISGHVLFHGFPVVQERHHRGHRFG